MLQADRLTKFYGALRAVEDLSFDVQGGEVFGLLGPNGSGKSTSVKIITGLLRQTRGVVRLNGRDVSADMLAYRRVLGYVPEEPHLYSYLTGPEYLELVGRLRGLDERRLRPRIDRCLALLELDEDRHQTLSAYSKGMRQKVLIAAAVLHDPHVLVLDEPFSGLDVSAARVLKAFGRVLAADGKIVVFSSHELEVVEAVCSRVLILKDGRWPSEPSSGRSSFPALSLLRFSWRPSSGGATRPATRSTSPSSASSSWRSSLGGSTPCRSRERREQRGRC